MPSRQNFQELITAARIHSLQLLGGEPPEAPQLVPALIVVVSAASKPLPRCFKFETLVTILDCSWLSYS